MIVMTNYVGALAGRVPELALRRAAGFSGKGIVLVLEEGDDVERDIPQAGPFGLMTHLDDAWQEPFSYVRYVTEGKRRVYEARLAYGEVPTIVVVPDETWVDDRLLLVLQVEGEEEEEEEEEEPWG